MATQNEYESSDNDSEFSEPPAFPPSNSQPFGDDSDMDFSEDDSAASPAPAAAEPLSEVDKRVFRATAFLKKAQQDAAAAEHYVFGAKAAAMELAKMHAKKVAAVKGAANRLAAAKVAKSKTAGAGRASGGSGSGEMTTTTRMPPIDAARPECASPKAAALAKVKAVLAEATAGVHKAKVQKKSKKI
jgi:hypothetical protein